MKWISVKDKLPISEDRKDMDVLVTNGVRCSVSAFDECLDLWCGGNIIQSDITHWMPLPHLPKDDHG